MATPDQIIAALPIGKNNAMKVADIERRIGNQPSGSNNDRTRREVKRLVNHYNLPLGSSSAKGYWIINSEEELQKVLDGIEATIEKYKYKQNSLIEGWERRKVSIKLNHPWPK